jgi:DNA replicative helicase MCM subunit Mcm2 (Cdc46/Mcm family)
MIGRVFVLEYHLLLTIIVQFYFCTVFLLQYYPLHSTHHPIGRFVQVKGTVVRVNPVQTPPSVLTFCCLRCNQILVLPQPASSSFTPPKKCTTPNCPSKQFSPDRTSPETQLRNRQLIRYEQRGQRM